MKRLIGAAGAAFLLVGIFPGTAFAAAPVLAITQPAAGLETSDNTPVFIGTTDCTAGPCTNITVQITGPTSQTLTAAKASPWTVTPTLPLTDGAYTVTAEQKRNGGGGGTTVTPPVSFRVDTTAPVVAFTTAPASVNEGSTATYIYSITDSGTVTSPVAADCNGPAATNTSNNQTSGSFDCTFPDGLATHSVTATATDAAGNVGSTVPAVVSVNNVAPTVNFTSPATAPTNVNQGDTVSFEYSISDPGTDTVDSVSPACGTGGTLSNPTNTNSSGRFDCTYATETDTSAAISARDSDLESGAGDSHAVNVDNRAPAPVSITGDSSVPETQSRTYSVSPVDPEGDPLTYKWTVVSGAASINGGIDDGSSVELDFGDGTTTSSVDLKVEVRDGINTAVTDTKTITLTNVAPTVSFTSPTTSANQGQTVSYSYTITDPGPDTITVDSGSPSCGSGGTVSDATNTSTSGSFKCTFSTDGAKTVSIAVSDDDGGTDSDSVNVTVANLAPSAGSITGNDSGAEGSSHTYSVSATDPENDTLSYSWSVTAGAASIDGAANASSVNLDLTDGPSSVTLQVVIGDGHGGNDVTKTKTITVNNVSPSVAFTTPTAAANQGQTISYSYTITDPGADAITSATPDCGAGGTVSNATNTNDSGSFDCTFTTDGTKTVGISVADSDGGTDSDSATVTVTNLGPTVGAVTGDATALEGETKTYSVAATDPEGDALTYAWTVTAGDATINGAANASSVDLDLTDGPSSVTLEVVVGDGHPGNDVTETKTITVSNVSPTVAFTVAPAAATTGTAVSYEYSITDPGIDGVSTATPSCAGGWISAATNTGASGSFDCTFVAAGSENVTASVADSDDDVSNTAATTVTVAASGGSGGGGGGGSEGGGSEGGSVASTPDPEPGPLPPVEENRRRRRDRDVSLPGDQTPPSLSGSTDTSLISPNDDGVLDEMSLQFDFSERAMWTFELVDPTGATERMGRGYGASVKRTWDGTIDGAVAPEGTYTWRVEGQDSAGNYSNVLSGEITVDLTSPRIGRVEIVKGSRLNQRKNPRRGSVQIRFQVDEHCSVVAVLQRRGKTFRRFGPVEADASGQVAIRWNGKLRNGRRARPGRYALVLTANDRAGNSRTVRASSVQLP